jgi:hypothetical protein
LRDKEARKMIEGFNEKIEVVSAKVLENSFMKNIYLPEGCYFRTKDVKGEINKINEKLDLLFKFLDVHVQYEPSRTFLSKNEKEKINGK